MNPFFLTDSLDILVAHPLQTSPLQMIATTTLSLSSAEGLISLLDEKDLQLQHYALKTLDKVVDQHWAEIADILTRM